MKPAGPLMIEHRLIERMIKIIKDEAANINLTGKANVALIEAAVDFIRTYADRCHHGKEEDILFRDLIKKPLTPEHKKILNELIAEHTQARAMVKALVAAVERYTKGDDGASGAVAKLMESLTDFYPVHIAKEDKDFFIPCMDYFTKQEQEKMLEEFDSFDRNLIHEKYTKIVESREKPASPPARTEPLQAISKKYKCRACEFVYDPEQGDPESGIAPGTPFKQIPDDWRCPLCGAGKSQFVPV